MHKNHLVFVYLDQGAFYVWGDVLDNPILGAIQQMRKERGAVELIGKLMMP